MKKTTNTGPSPDVTHPMSDYKGIVYIKNIIKDPRIEVGDYTCYDDIDNPENFEKNVLYNDFPFEDDKLIIGKFCSLSDPTVNNKPVNKPYVRIQWRAYSFNLMHL